MINEDTGKFLVEFSRRTIECFVSGKKTFLPPEYPDELDELRGVFVTLEKYPSGELRGCIGLPQPEKPLIDAVRDASCSAARDPRFPPLKEDELENVTIEISVLTHPENIEFSGPEELLKKIEPGKDGLILDKGWNTGLFLPQVWDKIPKKESFLRNLSYKAGLSNPDAWKNSTIRRFRVQAFKEKSPGQFI